MSKKIDGQGSINLAADGKGPWDSPDAAEPGAGGRQGGSKPEAVNPWDPTPDAASQQTRARGPSLEELLRRKGGGFGGLPKRPKCAQDRP